MIEIFIVIIILILIWGYFSTEPTKLNMYKTNAKKRHTWECAGYYYDWAPNLTSLDNPDFRSALALAPTPKNTPPKNISPTPCPCTPIPAGTTPGKTPCICPTPPKTPGKTTTPTGTISDCQGFVTAIGGLDGIVGCRNVLHAKCRDNNKNYKPANAAEQKCVDMLAKFSGNICNCMTQIHQVCL